MGHVTLTMPLYGWFVTRRLILAAQLSESEYACILDCGMSRQMPPPPYQCLSALFDEGDLDGYWTFRRQDVSPTCVVIRVAR